MAVHPETTARVVSIEPAGDTKVRLMLELIVDVHNLAEMGSEMLKNALAQIRAEDTERKRK
jgi:hypothetical protein